MLSALERQTRPPDEIVIVDGGSTDGTLDLIQRWSNERPAVRVLSAPNTNISAGRNVAIEAASHEWIACTDAGCRPIPTWLEAIDRARPTADLLTGVFTVDRDTAFERMIAATTTQIRQRSRSRARWCASRTASSAGPSRPIWPVAARWPSRRRPGVT